MIYCGLYVYYFVEYLVNNEKIEFEFGEVYSIMVDRCEECGFWNIPNTQKCPECGDIVDLSINGVCIAWICRKCQYAVASTANKLCYWDVDTHSKENFSKLDICVYAEVIK